MVEGLRLAQAARAWLPYSEVEQVVLCEIRYPLMGERAEVSAVLDGIEGFERGKDDEAHSWAVIRHLDMACSGSRRTAEPPPAGIAWASPRLLCRPGRYNSRSSSTS